ncbi:putative cyclic nucleotide-gated ion channel 8 isoform X5 [Pyrus x bretschneideri]|uniref:putative cyclic nucleotide-gated ion channel 8 isoform X5 n=1 Tax=Pyrus x bretschneideri TaxID=225117 RepID=UPI00202FC583|nr:putative cyclic nucleotide-gated ion channel 8 isoform X5 [Pyrus x bretschneideri]
MAMEVQIPRLHHCDLEENAAEKFPKNIREALKKLPKKKILDLPELVLQRWNQIVLVFCVIALSTDPLFLYLLTVNNEQNCLTLDKTLATVTALLRFSIDFFYIFHIIFQFRASNVAHSFQTSRQGESAAETRARARKYLLMYLLVDMLIILPLPQVTGAFWYFFSIKRITKCWGEACEYHGGAHCYSFAANAPVYNSCSANTMNFGIYYDALESIVLDSTPFVKRISYCFWWGIQNLSSLGQSLKPTTIYVWEIYFSLAVSITGLVLLAILAGNLQEYVLSKIARSEKMRLKKPEIEMWMYFHSLPRSLKARIWQSVKHKLKENIRIDVENFLHLLPVELCKDIKWHLCSGPLREVPILQTMDEQLLEAICKHLTPVLYAKNSIIFHEGEPIAEMLFVTRGKLLTYTASATARVRFLGKGDFYGEELFDWVLINCANLSNFPLSTETIKAQTEVEVFVLRAQQLKTVVSKFWWLFTKEQRRHSSLNTSFNVEQWKPRAAYALQAAWRRHKKETRCEGEVNY